MNKYRIYKKFAFNYIKKIRLTIHTSKNKIVFYNSLK